MLFDSLRLPSLVGELQTNLWLTGGTTRRAVEDYVLTNRAPGGRGYLREILMPNLGVAELVIVAAILAGLVVIGLVVVRVIGRVSRPK